MTAPALNTVNTALPGASSLGQTAPGAAAAAAGNPLAGFEALLAALFSQADPTAAAPTAAAVAPAKGKGDLLAGAKDKDGNGEAATGEPTDAPALPADAASAAATDPNAALAACLVATPVATVETAPTTTVPDADATSHALAKPGFPNIPRVLLPTPPARKGELAVEAAPEGATDIAGDDTAPIELATLATQRPQGAKGDKPAPPAYGQDKAPGQPAAPALANANPNAHLAEKAEAARPDVPAPEAAPAPVAVEAPAPAITTALATRPEPAATTAAPAKPAKAERGKASTETLAAGDVKAPASIDKPATAHPVTAAGKPASAESELADAAAEPAKPAADQPEAAFSAEAHATTASNAPAQHTAHAVRGAPETVANLAAQIVKKLEGKSTRFDVELDPAGLGKVNVRIDIGAQGAITAAMSFDNPQAAAELRSRAAELQRALEQAGFNLSGGVTFDVAQDRGQHGQPWQGAGQDQADNNGRAFRGQAFQSALDTAGDAANAAVNGALRLRRGVSAGLDMRI